MSKLKEWKKQQKENLIILGLENLKQKQLVFPNKSNEWTQPSKTTRWLDGILEKYNLNKITTHGFSHTHCSMYFEAGMSIEEVQDILSHKDIETIMNIYTHISKKEKTRRTQSGRIHGLLKKN